MEGKNGRELQEVLQRAWQAMYGSRGQGPPTAPEMKKSRTILQTPLLAAGAFNAALAGVPAEDWCRTWPADTTIMLRRTSKTVKQTVEKMRLPADVRLSRSFWREHKNLTDADKRNLVMKQLSLMTAWCIISTLDLHGLHWGNPFAFNWNTDKEHTDAIFRVLAQCSVLSHLDLGLNRMGPSGAESLAPVLGQFATLTHLNLSGNLIGPKGARSLGRVLGNFTALVHLDLSGNVLGADGAQSLVGVLVHSTTLTKLDLGFNEIGPEGAENLMMLVQCTALTHIILDANFIDHGVLRALGADRRGRDRRRHSEQKKGPV